MTWRVVLAVAAGLAAACASAPPRPAHSVGDAPPVRCYALRYTGPEAGTFPARIGFPADGDSVWGEPGPEGRRVWHLWPHGVRAPLAGDSVRVRFSNGLTALVLDFVETPGSLSGGRLLLQRRRSRQRDDADPARRAPGAVSRRLGGWEHVSRSHSRTFAPSHSRTRRPGTEPACRFPAGRRW